MCRVRWAFPQKLRLGNGTRGLQWEWEREVVVVAVQREVVVEESASLDRRSIIKFYLSNLVVGNGNGNFSSGDA